MIRPIGHKEDPTEYIGMMESRLRGMEELSATHITWYTHKNPYGCWICDMFLLAQRLIDSFKDFLGPTPADVQEGQTSLKDYSERLEDDNDFTTAEEGD